jgi:hypothetical protein
MHNKSIKKSLLNIISCAKKIRCYKKINLLHLNTINHQLKIATTTFEKNFIQ